MNIEDDNVWVHGDCVHDQLVLGSELHPATETNDEIADNSQRGRSVAVEKKPLSNLVPGDKVQWSDQVCVWCYIRK